MKEIQINDIKEKRLMPSLSVPNFKDKNKNKYSFIDNNIKLNFNYAKIDQDNINSEYKNSIYNRDKIVNQDEYKYFLYEKEDNYEELVIKNKNLKRLFEQVNHKLLICLKKQQEIESKYENEKKEIIEKLDRIQEKYEIYASSHQQLNNFEDKIDEISTTYNQLLELYFKTNENFKEYKNNLNKLYKNINDFIENNYDNDLVNILSFEFLLHLRNEMKNQFKFNDFSLDKNNIIKAKNHKEILNNKTARYYTKNHFNNDFELSQIKNKKTVKNIFNANTNIYLINKTRINSQLNSKYIDNDKINKKCRKKKDKDKEK